jgi:hypothetical protein
LYAKLGKCESWLKQVAFLGHIISRGGIFLDPSKVQDVPGWRYSKFSWIGWILSEVYQRILKNKYAHDRVTREGQEVQVDASL